MITFIILEGVGVLLFAVNDGGWEQPQQTSLYQGAEAPSFYNTSESALTSFLASLAVENNSRSDIDLANNDQDHDGNYDGIADPLAGLAIGSAVLVIVLGLVALVGVKLLLNLCEPPTLSSIWPQILERPG